MDFISQPAERPFFLSLHFEAPGSNSETIAPDGGHTWLPLPEEDWKLFEDVDPQIHHCGDFSNDISRRKRMTREYLASVHGVDRNIGRILWHLEELKLLDETIIVFASDNGSELGCQEIMEGQNPEIGSEKKTGNLLTRCHRVPALIRWPPKIPAGRVFAARLSSLDWFPTLCGLAGIQTDSAWSLGGTELHFLGHRSKRRPPAKKH